MINKTMTASLAAIAALMMVSMPFMAMDLTSADGEEEVEETYYVYVDLTADRTLNGEWFSTTATAINSAINNACNDAYGAANNSIASGGWITTINGVTSDYNATPSTSWASYYWNATDSEWAKVNSYNEETNFVAIFFTEYLQYVSMPEGETWTYTDEGKTLDSAGVLALDLDYAEYGSATMPDGYTAKLALATDADAEGAPDTGVWNIRFATVPDDIADSFLTIYADEWGYYMAMDDTAVGDGLSIVENTVTVDAADVTAYPAGDATFVFKYDGSLAGYDVAVEYDPAKLTYVSAADMTGYSPTVNADTPGIVYINASGATGVDVTGGMFSMTFGVVSETPGDVAAVHAKLNTLVLGDSSEINYSGSDAVASSALVTVVDAILKPGSGLNQTYASDENNLVTLSYDPAVLSIVSTNGAYSAVIDNGMGAATLTTSATGGNVTVKYRVVDNPVIGDTTVTANSVESTFDITGDAFLVVPDVETVDGVKSVSVSMYNVPEIAGFKFVFNYTGTTTPVVTDISGLSGGLSTAYDAAAKTLTVMWASSANENANGNLFKVTGVDSLVSTTTELRAIQEDLTTKEIFVDVTDDLSGSVESDTVGNVNQDGATDLADLILLMQYLAGQNVTMSETAADLNFDGSVTIADAMALSRIVMAA